MKSLAKIVARTLAFVFALPFIILATIGGPCLGRDRAFQNTCQAVSLLPGLTGQYIRRAFLAFMLDGCHGTATIEFGTLFSRRGARIDANVYVGPGCNLGWVHVGKDTLLASGVTVPSGAATHGIDDSDIPIREQPGDLKQIRIGEGCWIGSSAVIMAHVGAGTVIAAGAVVTRDIPAGVIAGGIPARVLSERAGSKATGGSA